MALKHSLKKWLVSKQRASMVENTMSFFDHLDVLRKHLVRSVIGICVTTILAFAYFDKVFDVIIMGPRKADFWTYRIMCLFSEHFNFGEQYCVKAINFKIINTELSGQITLQINASLLVGIIAAFPYVLFELWQFIKPALTEKERKSTNGFVSYACLLFLLGVLFGYFLIAPYSIRFLAGFEVSSQIQNQITIDSYLSTVVTLTLACGVIFELPMVVLVLTKLGLLTPEIMRSSRRYAIIIMLVIAAVVTPTPDMQTMLIVTCPLLFLYEISILVAARVYRKQNQIQACKIE